MKKEKLQELDFLKKSNHNDLYKLARCIIYGPGNGKRKRLAQGLSERRAYKEHEKESLPDAVEDIIDEFLLCGGTTSGNLWRKQEGVSYREILSDICSRLGIYHDKQMSIMMLERKLITYLIERCLSSDTNIVDKLYTEWCANEPIYLAENGDIDDKVNRIMDYCFARYIDKDDEDNDEIKYNLKTKTMPFIISELDKMFDSKEYEGWLKDIYSDVTRVSTNNPAGILNYAVHSFNYIQGAAYDVTFPATIYIIYMRIKNS